jgi:hypothetical protein
MKKMFKIGEYAIGGIIRVEIVKHVISVKALDWNTKKVVNSGYVVLTERDASELLQEYLHTLTSSYYAEKILDWVRLYAKV